MLIVFGGLPGTGKTTVAKEVARCSGAVFLRIDEIKQALHSCEAVRDIGPAGYVVAYALARSNLDLGRVVVADCVNPLTVTREAWKEVAFRANVPILEVEMVCSDSIEHRRRVETRSSDVPKQVSPTWDHVCRREYEPWTRPRLVIDTADTSLTDAVSRILAW